MPVDLFSLPMAWQSPLTFLPTGGMTQSKAILFPELVIQQVDAANMAWENWKDLFRQKSPLRTSIESLANSPDQNQDWDTALTALVEAFGSNDYHLLQRPLRQILTTLNPQQLGQLFESLVNQGIDGKGLESLHKCLSLLPLADLEKALSQAIQSHKKTPAETLEAFALAEKEYRKLLTNSNGTKSEETKSPFVKMVRNFIDTCLMALRISDIGKEATSPWEANERLSSYVQLAGYAGLVFAGLCAVCPIFVAAVVTGAVCAVAALGTWAYMKWVQTSPDNISYCQNLTTEAMEGAFAPVLGRESEIDEIINCLASSTDGHRAHPLLCGPSGVGKTEIVRGIAQRIATGNVPECLQEKKLLYINTAELVGKYGSNTADRLEYILDKMGKNKKDYIVFFDEIHNVMKGTADIGERLKTILDTNSNGLPYCIAATTQDEYEKLIAPDFAFTRRFQRITILPTDKKQTMLIMREMVNKEAPEIGVSEPILEKIFDATTTSMPKLHQPASSKRILSKAISNIRIREELLTSPAILKKQKKLADLSSALHANPDSSTTEDTLDKMQKLQKDIKTLQDTQAAANKASAVLHRLKRFRAEQITAMFEMARKASEGKSDAVETTRFVFWNYYVVPYLKTKIESYPADAVMQINEQLIDELIIKDQPPETPSEPLSDVVA